MNDYRKDGFAIFKKTLSALLGLIMIFIFIPSCKFQEKEHILDYTFGSGKHLPEYVTVTGKTYPVRHYSITAIKLRIVYNKFGDHDPEWTAFRQ